MNPAQSEYQRATYDDHYPKMATAVREQLGHPLLCSFYDRLAERILDSVEAPPEPLHMLEAGCGEGLVASAVQRVARRRGWTFTYTGTDLSTAGIELARSLVEGEFLQGDAVDIASQLPTASLDLIWAKNLLHHLDGPAEFLRQAIRALRPSGRVVIVEPRMWCPVHWINLMWFRQERYLFRGYRRNVAAFAAAGCRVDHTQEFGWLPYELALATRFSPPRRLLSMRGQPALDRVSRLDDRLTARFPRFALYMVSVIAADVTATGPAG